MDKKIVKTMFNEIVSKETVRPLMTGVHFEEKRCYATDTHVLIVYKESDPRFAGKTLSSDGEEIKGNYPPIDRVIPNDVSHEFTGDKAQLHRALVWWSKQKDSHPDDLVVIGNQTFRISYLRRMLNMFSMTCELRSARLWLNEQGRPAKMESETFTAIAMPCTPVAEESIDDERNPESPMAVSYANLINTFALEGSKPKVEIPSAFDWLNV